ncbi:MAG: hypothetical protein KAU38_02700 [Desulfobacterales bacterium]|nr:hypothetical protein [Desulfobacterales bacterium]
MRRSHRETFTTIRTEGALLPVEILQRIAEGDRHLEGLSPESYHLSKNEKLNGAINRAWNRCEGAWRSFQATAREGRQKFGTPNSKPETGRMTMEVRELVEVMS